MAAGSLQPARKPHALVVPWPGQGHINPMMHLSKKLASRGVAITFANTQFNHDRLIQSHNESQVPLPREAEGLDIRLVGFPNSLGDEENVANDVQKQVEILCQSLMKMDGWFTDLVEKLEPPVTCIITDVFVTSTHSAARKFGIPHVAFWTQSAACYALHAMFTAGYRPPRENPVRDGEVLNLITCIPGSPPLRFKEVPSFLQPCDNSDYMFWYSTYCIQQVHESAFIIFNTYDDFEEASLKYIRKHNPNMRTIGPILPSEFFSSQNLKQKSGTSLWPEDYGCLEWLDEQEPSSVLYVSFGSLAVLTAQQIQEFATGLETTQFPILMVIRPTVMYGESAVFPEGFADRMKGRSMFVEWAPQLQVLSHVAVGGFLTHCGWNSTLESISKGIPMLCWPYFGDQMMDCRYVVDGWRIGLELEADENGLVSRVEVEKKVRTLMDSKESKEMRERAAKLRDAANTAVMEGGSSYTDFEPFMNFLT